MKTIYDGKLRNDEINIMQVKTKSASVQLPIKSSENILKIQISAPFYLHSLRENQAPPFKKPEREEKPHLLIGTIVNEDDVIEMIAVVDRVAEPNLKKHLGKFLIHKKLITNDYLLEKSFLVSLLIKCIDYAAQRDFSASKLACLMTIYLATHNYFKWYYWLPTNSVWKYFKEILIKHTIEDSPDGQEVYDSEESYDILTHFHTIYLSNLPLIHILTFNVHRLKLLWPFKPKL